MGPHPRLGRRGRERDEQRERDQRQAGRLLPSRCQAGLGHLSRLPAGLRLYYPDNGADPDRAGCARRGRCRPRLPPFLDRALRGCGFRGTGTGRRLTHCCVAHHRFMGGRASRRAASRQARRKPRPPESSFRLHYELTVSVKACVALGVTPLAALIVSGQTPAVAVVEIARVAVPLPRSVNVTPEGRVTVSVSAGTGYPVVVTVKLPPVPAVNAAVAKLVIAGAWSTVSVKACVALLPTPLEAVKCRVYSCFALLKRGD